MEDIWQSERGKHVPYRVVGIHADPLLFPAIEVIKTLVTSNETFDISKKFVESLKSKKGDDK